MFLKFNAKLGNMKKSVEWVICPRPESREVIVQCNKRIAKINLDTGMAVLSSGKGGHNGFVHLSPMLGATECVVPQDVLEQVESLAKKLPKDGRVLLVG